MTAQVCDACLDHDASKIINLIKQGDHDWMLPTLWADEYKSIRKSYQWIQMKIKLFFIYEELDNSITLTFQELMNYPNLPEEYFPKHYFDELLKQLTRDQKQRYLHKYE